MARGTPRSFDERLLEIDIKIEKAQQTLNDLKAQRKEIEAAKQVDLLSKVESAAKAKGVTVEELLESIIK